MALSMQGTDMHDKGWQYISIKAILHRLHMMMCMTFRCKGMASFSYHFYINIIHAQ
jgi:hypothetical protein